MKNKISQLIDDFHERDLPDPVSRAQVFPQIKGKADVVIGMRRAGKTWFCYQKIIELLKAGIRKNDVLIYMLDIRTFAFTLSNANQAVL